MSYDPILHSGGEGTGVLDGSDLNVTQWSGGPEATLVEITTTGDYDTTDKITYERRKATKAVYKAKLDAWIDTANFQLAGVKAGDEILNVVLTMVSGHTVSMAKAIIESMPVDTGGTAGVSSFSVNIFSQGKFTIS